MDELKAGILLEMKAQHKETLTVMDNRLLEINDKLENVTGRMAEIEKENSYLRKRLQQIEEVNENSDQNSRKYNLIIYGLKEEFEENSTQREEVIIDFIATNLKLTLAENEIDKSYRLGKRITSGSQNQGGRPILVRLISQKKRNSILIEGKKP
ncbi:hypothetical protein SNE40_009685 [Patella caerulea]|uniref:Endonuclease-reverse transcriptase n=1 Tax=Patella caerulea TaxID=87958 RepID=A0AAN8JP51_PATCE